MAQPEEHARLTIDQLLGAAGWQVCDPPDVHISAHRGVAIREFPLKQGHGFADYLLYVDGRAAGAIEAKKEVVTLSGVETQAAKYTQGLPDGLPAWRNPLPFAYQSTGAETRFTNGLDPEPRTRGVFAFHRPETFAELLDGGRVTFDPNQLDRDVVAPDQIRKIIQTYRDKLFTEIFPGRTWVPKTLIFAKGETETGEHPVHVRPAERAGHGWPTLGFRAERDARAKKYAHTPNTNTIALGVCRI